jgi:hypothetical protein
LSVPGVFVRRFNRRTSSDGCADLPPQQHQCWASRSWTDHLLWHHAAHTVDLSTAGLRSANAIQGPIHLELGIDDMSIQLKAANGDLYAVAVPFNNDGPVGTATSAIPALYRATTW